MAKLQVQPFAKIPNEYVVVERSRGLLELEEKLVYMLINAMQKRAESIKRLIDVEPNFVASGTISFAEFCNTMQIGNKNNKLILKSLWNLHQFGFAIRRLHLTKFIHLFKEFELNEQDLTIAYQFDDNFITFFTGICKDYFNLSVQEVIGLHSSYAIRIYQLLKSKLNMDKKEHDYTIVELKKMLNIEDKYKDYHDFKRFVLTLSKEQINSSEASLFAIDYEVIKTGKAVTSIKFIIQQKGRNYYAEQNKLPNYKLEKIKKLLATKWLQYPIGSVVRDIAEKLKKELSYKKPSMATVENYVRWIEQVADIDLPKLPTNRKGLI